LPGAVPPDRVAMDPELPSDPPLRPPEIQ